MTTYNTGNALGSADARDLYDNAENIDNFANGSANAFNDRLGVSRKSIAGMENAFDAFVQSSGYTVPVAYTSGIVLSAYNQLIEYNNEFYKLKAGQSPYTTTGTWGTDSAKLVSVGDAALRQELADDTGSSLVGYMPAGTGAAESTVEEKLRELVSITDFGAVGDGVANDRLAFIAFVEHLAANGVIGYVPAGTYLLTGAHIEFNALSNITIYCDQSVIFLDEGRDITGAGGTRRIPWGIEFIDCASVTIIGGTVSTPLTGMSGSSTGIFDSTNYLQRKPVLGFVDCTGVKLDGVKQRGDPGVGISTADRDAIISALSLTPTPAEYGYFGMRNAFFNFYGCNDVVVIDNEIVPDTGARDRFTFLNCDNVSVVRPTSISAGNNFASLGKVIQCSNVVVDDCKVTDTGTGSLWDFIGQNITFKNTNIDYPNGKLCDISHEWGPANAPSDNILVADCTTNGMGVTNVTGASTTSQVVDNPITNVRIRNVRANKGKSSWSANVDWVRLPSVINYVVEGSYVENGSIGFTHTNNGGQRIELRDLTMRWTVASGSLLSNARTFNVPTEMNFYGCDIDADATGAGVSSLSISGASGAPCRFIGCKINDTVFATSNPAVEFIGCVINSSSITASGSGSISYKNCVVDGVLTNSGANGAVVKLHRLDTTIVAGEEYGGWEFVGNDSSSGASGVRASLKVIAEGAGGDVYLSYSTAPINSTTLTERFRIYSNGSVAIPNMPTSAPATAKTLWSDGGTIKITA